MACWEDEEGGYEEDKWEDAAEWVWFETRVRRWSCEMEMEMEGGVMAWGHGGMGEWVIGIGDTMEVAAGKASMKSRGSEVPPLKSGNNEQQRNPVAKKRK